MEQTPPKQKNIITIAGRPGSGKSTTAKGVAAYLGYQHFSSGDLFRAIARDHGVDVFQANVSAEQNAEIDFLVDKRLRELGANEDQLVIDSRMAWHWIPQSFKVFLNLDLSIAAERILQDIDEARLQSEHIRRNPTEYAARLKERLASETRRYKQLYDSDPYNMDNYDLVIDTHTNSKQQVIDQILAAYADWHS